ncbi:four helix bundle protein [bacterium]|nr:four helix bundle protein [bacterium]
MAQYYHLPIYKASYDLLIALMFSIKDFPREFKYTVGERIQNAIIELVISIYRANSSREKSDYIKSILESIQYINLLLRITKDLKLITEMRYASFVEQTASIAKQSQGWLATVI